MSEEKINQELSDDELKDVAGGMGELRSDHIGALKPSHVRKDKSNKSLGITNGGNGTLSAEDLGNECRGMGLDRLGTNK